MNGKAKILFILKDANVRLTFFFLFKMSNKKMVSWEKKETLSRTR